MGKLLPYQPPHKRLSNAEIEERRIRSLCFWSNDKFTFGHKCTNRKLYSLVMEPNEDEREISDIMAGESEREGHFSNLSTRCKIKIPKPNYEIG